MTARTCGIYMLCLFFIGIPVSIILWLMGIWSDDLVREENLYQTAGVSTVVTIFSGMLGGIMSAD